ncbi:MAG TPA: SRPBCC domain-containing protein [Candidatus Micrarchaeaceae archaeon]|nr:SRPBCC domain-containing protein [Candidatus Micrarchaeaceae archaeon]
MSSNLSRAIEALTDPGRRELLEQLGAGPKTAAQLIDELAAPGPVLVDRLETLEGAGLVAEDHTSPLITYQVNSKGVEELRDYLERIANVPRGEISGVPVDRVQPVEADPDARFLVHREIELHRSVEAAFQLFTTGMGEWWPLGRRHFGESPAVTIVMEPTAGGRWYERDDDGSESPWGETLVFEAPHRVVLGWAVNSEWRYDPTVRSEIEVTFAAQGPEDCSIRLEHRSLEQMGEEAARLQATFDSAGGWPDLLHRFVEAAERSEAP